MKREKLQGIYKNTLNREICGCLIKYKYILSKVLRLTIDL